MSAFVDVLSPGLLTTVQDLGRWGYQASGVPVSGPMDPFAHRLANALAGNPRSAATLEVTIVGPSLRPEVSWLRGEFDLGIPTPIADPIPGLAEPVSVTGRAGSQSYEFAFVPAAYTAVRAWLESSPPGFNVNVA